MTSSKTVKIKPDLSSDPEISASLLAADPLNILHALQACAQAQVHILHIDIMDDVFVPNLAINYATIAAIAKRYPQFELDVHLMVTDPFRALQKLRNISIRRIFFHPSPQIDCLEVIKRIHALNAQAGCVINPDEPWSRITPYLRATECGLIMGVTPGFSGQKFQTQCLLHLDRIKEHPEVSWALDGGVKPEIAHHIATYDIDHYVLGSGLFQGNVSKNLLGFSSAINRVKELAHL